MSVDIKQSVRDVIVSDVFHILLALLWENSINRIIFFLFRDRYQKLGVMISISLFMTYLYYSYRVKQERIKANY